MTTQATMPLYRMPPEALEGIGPNSRAGRMYEALRDRYPYPVGLTLLESIAFTKVTNRISDLRKPLKAEGWKILNEMTRSHNQIFSNYRLVAHDG